jgi:hypothetical protein
LLAVLVAALTVFGVTAVVAPSGSAALAVSGVGPVDPASNFPAYFTDTNGLGLQLCQDGLPNCLAGPEPIQDVHAGGDDAEAFYYAEDASTTHFALHNALAAAYAGDGPGREVVFQRTQVTARGGGLPANTRYAITDPYGTYACTSDADGEIRQNACRIGTTPVEGEFNRALGGRLGPFLTWDTFASPSGAPPAGFIGDGTTPHKVVGSATGFNAFRVTGPGLTGTCTTADGSTVSNCEQTDLFIVQGKVAPGGPSASLSSGALDFGDIPSARPVTKTLTYANTGSLPVTISSVAVSGTGAVAFQVTHDCPVTPATLDVGTRCTVDVTFTPQSGASSAAALTITDDTPAATRTVGLKGSNLGVLAIDNPVPPAALTFPSQPVDSASAEDNVVVANTGDGPLTIASVTITGSGASHFRLGPNNSCTTPVDPDGGCEVGVVFAPTTTGGKTANLRVTDSHGTVAHVPLTGTAATSTLPGVPTAVTATAGNGAATVSWTAPTSTGGSAISGHSVRAFSGTDLVRTVPVGNVVTTNVTGLTNGTAYTFDVAAINAVGAGACSARTAAVTPVPANVPPTVTARTPAVDAMSVGPADDVTATFSEAVQGVSGRTVILRNAAGAAVAATVTYDATTRVATLDPTAGLVADSRYTASLSGSTTGIRDLLNAPLAPVSWSFTTGPAPTVSARTPASGAVAVSTTGNITATLSEAVAGVSGSSFVLRNGAGTQVAATVTYNSTTRVATLDPTATLPGDTPFTVTLTGGATAVRDLAGNPLVTTSWTFLTGAAPTVTARAPLSAATGVSRTADVTATLSEAVSGVSATTFTLRNATTGAAVTAVVTRNGTTDQWILDPSVTLAADTRYTATLTGGTTSIRDVAGNPLTTTTWSFTTGA